MSLEIQSLSIHVLDQPLITDFTLSIADGERVVLTGASGRGKTSILYAILNQLPLGATISGGLIQWHDNLGTILNSNSNDWQQLLKHKIGFIPQDVFGAWDPTQKIGSQIIDTVKLITNRNSETLKEELEGMLINLGLEQPDKILSSYPHQLSGGQLQRSLIAYTLLKKPSLLIMDEPTSALDRGSKEVLLSTLRSVSEKTNLAIFISTHDISSFDLFCDRFVHLDQSHIHDQLAVTEIREKESKPTLLQCEKLVYSYPSSNPNVFTIGPVDFTLREGDSMVIAGKSGSGKSSLSNLLTGWLKPESGTLTCLGRTINFKKKDDIRFLRSNIQIVPQDGRGSLHPNKSTQVLLGDIYRSRNLAINEKEIMDSLSKVGLPGDVLDKKPGQLSGGECLRVAICRAILAKPRILLCDESTTGLDSHRKVEILRLLNQLRIDLNLGLILITHDPEVALSSGNAIVLLDSGSVVENGTVNSILENGNSQAGKIFFGRDATKKE